MTIIDGVIHHSSIFNGKAQRLEPEVVKTVFNVRAECSSWERMSPFVAKDVSDFEAKLKTEKIFFFKMKAHLNKSTIHIVEGVDKTIMKPAKKIYESPKATFTLVGVYSPKHQRIFTHHDRLTHIHVIDQNGLTFHLDEAYGIEIQKAKVCYVSE